MFVIDRLLFLGYICGCFCGSVCKIRIMTRNVKEGAAMFGIIGIKRSKEFKEQGFEVGDVVKVTLNDPSFDKRASFFTNKPVKITEIFYGTFLFWVVDGVTVEWCSSSGETRIEWSFFLSEVTIFRVPQESQESSVEAAEA